MVLVSLTLAYAIFQFILLPFLWWWLLVFNPAKKAWAAGHNAPLWNLYAIQFSIFAVLAPLFLNPMMMLISLIFPPNLLISPIVHAGQKLMLLSPILLLPTLIGVSLTTLVFVVLWLLNGTLRRWALLPALCVGLIVFLPYTNHQAKNIIRTALEDFGGECLVASTFLQSVGFAGAEFQFNLHAITIRDAQIYGWSYGEMGFYLIPERAPYDGNGKYRACMAQIGE